MRKPSSSSAPIEISRSKIQSKADLVFQFLTSLKNTLDFCSLWVEGRSKALVTFVRDCSPSSYQKLHL